MRAITLVALAWCCHDVGVGGFHLVTRPSVGISSIEGSNRQRALRVQDPNRRRHHTSVVSFALNSVDATSRSSLSDGNSTSSLFEDGAGAAGSDAASETAELTPALAAPAGNKLRRLKDMMWVREALEDLTAAEFACTVEAEGMDDDENDAKRRSKRSRKRAVDYEKLLTQLNRRIRDLGCEDVSIGTNPGDAADVQCELKTGMGMGSLTYSDFQRSSLLQRLIRTRVQLVQVIHGNKIDVGSENYPFLQMPSLPRMEIPKEDVEDALSPKLYVRDDGTVDWDGALTSGAALRKFGTAVWARINGRDSDSVDDETAVGTAGTGHAPSPSRAVTAKIVETLQIVESRQKLEILKGVLVQMERDHYGLLNSAISQGQATANVKLAALEPKLRSRIQASAAALENMKVNVSFQTLLFELERIYTYLVGELGNPALNGYIPLQDRLNVAEFGLLESQVDSFNRQFMDNQTVDEDVLAVVFEQLTDFKRRLGIDYYVAGLSFDREAIGRWLGELLIKTRKGLAFYVKGVRLFWNDFVFCLRLINRAAQGYTLKPREVRTIRYVLSFLWPSWHPLRCTTCFSALTLIC